MQMFLLSDILKRTGYEKINFEENDKHAGVKQPFVCRWPRGFCHHGQQHKSPKNNHAQLEASFYDTEIQNHRRQKQKDDLNNKLFVYARFHLAYPCPEVSLRYTSGSFLYSPIPIPHPLFPNTYSPLQHLQNAFAADGLVPNGHQRAVGQLNG